MRHAILLCTLFMLSCGSRPPDVVDASVFETDAGTANVDAGVFESDAGFPCGLMPLENPNNADKECTFNSDCPLAQRCECEDGVCVCRTGPRGEGCAGVEPCTDGNDCQSSLCAEGNTGYFCSGPCEDDAACGENLPLCRDIAFIGKMCVRRP